MIYNDLQKESPEAFLHFFDRSHYERSSVPRCRLKRDYRRSGLLYVFHYPDVPSIQDDILGAAVGFKGQSPKNPPRPPSSREEGSSSGRRRAFTCTPRLLTERPGILRKLVASPSLPLHRYHLGGPRRVFSSSGCSSPR